jgi:5-deoxy-5-amino-3-dehydroquinate synthase
VSRLEKVTVGLGERGYDVVIGPGARHELSAMVPPAARRAVVVTQEGIDFSIDPGVPFETVLVGKGEAAKNLASLEALGSAFARYGLTRDDVVISLGGGLVSDLAGFAAACWHRGTPVIHVATTLLAQVDAAIGGKTGVNLPEGKNLMGVFWQPCGVICDTDALYSLPPDEVASGRGEMAKYAFLGVEDLDELDLVGQVTACVALKAAVVSDDEREAGRRAVLNYGHTLAHALEAAGLAEGEGQLRHGEAVAVGLVFAARLAERLGRIDAARRKRHEEVVAGYGLSSRLPAGADPARLVELMRRDKKARGDLSFVLDGPGGVELVRQVDPGVVIEVLSQMGGI